MKSSELVKLLNLHDSTLRKYAQVYAEFLSPTGAGGPGHHRDYTEQDARILKLILDMKAQRFDADNIDATLSSLKADDWQRLPALDEASQSLMPTPGALINAQAERGALEARIEELRLQLERTEARADEQIARVTADRDELMRRLHEAEQLVKLYESGRLKPGE